MTAGLGTGPTATTFDVEDVVAKAWNGTIRIPRLQRGFRWTSHDVTLLFDSIARNYPVGNLLFWVRPAPAQTVRLGPFTTDAPSLGRALWTVDGQQRIISLANALRPDPPDRPTGPLDPRFALAYDLDKARFVPRPRTERAETIPLPVLFDLHLLIRWFSDYPEVADQLDQASNLTRTIRQFEIPAYLVEQDDAAVLPTIFDRMNNAGRPLRRAEVFAALFAPADADQEASPTITGIAEDVAADLGFGQLDDETVLRAVLARRGPDAARDVRGEFDADRRAAAEFPDESRDDALTAGRDALVRAVGFLQDEAGVPHMTFMSYRYLLVVLARVFAHHKQLDPRNARLLRRWYWRAALVGTEPFRGSSTGAARAFCSRVRPDDLSGSIQDLLAVVGTDERRLPNVASFRTNDAAGKVVLCALWSQEPRSPRTGKPYDRWQLANALSGRATAADALATIVPPRTLPAEARRWAANAVMLADPDDAPAGEVDAVFTTQLTTGFSDSGWLGVLRSHCMTRDLVRLLDGDPAGFLVARQEIISAELRRFVERMCEWEFEDTPPLEYLLADDFDEDDDGPS
jgi:hypothetical protein